MSTPSTRPQQGYVFGDNGLAAARLELLARVFEPSTRDFLRQFDVGSIDRVADVGCGPGHTSRLLADVFVRAAVTGLDNSPAFLELARQAEQPRLRFELADAAAPLPGGPYDLIYSRYLLTHLPQPRAALQAWALSLRRGGQIAIEENAWIRTEVPAFAEYLAIVERLLAEGGKRLYIGDELGNWSDQRLTVVLNQTVPIVTRDCDAARMFAMNLETLRHEPAIKGRYAEKDIQRLATKLGWLVENAGVALSISFGRQRVVYAWRG